MLRCLTVILPFAVPGVCSALEPGSLKANPVSLLLFCHSYLKSLTETSVPAGTGKSDEKVDLTRENKLAQFNNWFTWCHNCRHGGHAGHMLSWFRWESHHAAHVEIIVGGGVLSRVFLIATAPVLSGRIL